MHINTDNITNFYPYLIKKVHTLTVEELGVSPFLCFYDLWSFVGRTSYNITKDLTQTFKVLSCSLMVSME